MVLVHYFKYKKRQTAGYAKISEESDIKLLQKCKLEGFNFIRTHGKYVYFKIDNQLYRLLKLSYLGKQSIPHNVKFLNFMIGRSEKIEKDEVNQSGYEFVYNYDYYYEEEKSIQRAEYKERIRNQNRQYNQKYKLGR